jgi:hypothetical protein
MNTTTKSYYLLLFRGNVWDRGLSLTQLQKVVSNWMAWFERLKTEGKCNSPHSLKTIKLSFLYKHAGRH